MRNIFSPSPWTVGIGAIATTLDAGVITALLLYYFGHLLSPMSAALTGSIVAVLPFIVWMLLVYREAAKQHRAQDNKGQHS